MENLMNSQSSFLKVFKQRCHSRFSCLTLIVIKKKIICNLCWMNWTVKTEKDFAFDFIGDQKGDFCYLH